MNDNISEIINIMNDNFSNVNETAEFNINKRIHPSYSKKTTSLITSLNPISLTTSKIQKSFPKLPNKNIKLQSSEIILPKPKESIILPKPKESIILPKPKESIILPKSPRSTIILPKSPKSTVILPKSPKSTVILPKSPKSTIILPKSPKSTVILPETITIKTVKVTNLEPEIPQINNLSRKLISKEYIPKTIDLPQMNTTIKSQKSRPIITNIEISNIPEIPDIDDIHRKILLGVDFSKLRKTRHGKNNDTYDLPSIKELAKSIKVSTKDNKDDIIERIENRAIQLGININKK